MRSSTPARGRAEARIGSRLGPPRRRTCNSDLIRRPPPAPSHRPEKKHERGNGSDTRKANNGQDGRGVAADAGIVAKAKQEQQKKEWYEDDRDRGLDVASEYAPKQIAKVRKNNYLAKGDTVNTGNGKKGWQQYMDKYYSR